MNSFCDLKLSTSPELFRGFPDNMGKQTLSLGLKFSETKSINDPLGESAEKYSSNDGSEEVCPFDGFEKNKKTIAVFDTLDEDFAEVLRQSLQGARFTFKKAQGEGLEEMAFKMHCAQIGYELHKPIKLSLNQMLKLGTACLGWKVHVETTEGNHVGCICWMLEHCHRLGLSEVSKPGSGFKKLGLVLVFYRCIKSVTLISKGKHHANSQSQRQQGGNALAASARRKALLMKKIVPPCSAQLQEEEEEGEKEELSTEEVPPLPPVCEGMVRPGHWQVVDRLDSLYDAISEIGQCECIGMSSFGHQLGRHGQLAWLCLATPSTVFLFDVASLGEHSTLHGPEVSSKATTAFGDNNSLLTEETADEQGSSNLRNAIYETETSCAMEKKSIRCLKDVLESNLIMKVVHDSRNVCDLLYHQCNITIHGLYDVQATELYLYMLDHKGDCPAFVPPLSSLLVKYLQLSPSHLLYEKNLLLGEDSSCLHERPLPHSTLSALATSAMFLCEVKEHQHHIHTADLRQLTAVHSMAYALKDDLTRSRMEHHVVPTSVQTLGRRTVLKFI